MISLLLAIAIIYALVLGWVSLGVSNLSRTKLAKPATFNKFSILIPFRDEEQHLPALLNDLAALDYQKDFLQLILIDDGSTDRSAEIVSGYLDEHPELVNPLLINASEHGHTGKKQALSLGIESAKHPWIVTLDADTRLPNKWLHFLNLRLSQDSPKMVCGPIGYTRGQNWLERFQVMDNLALQTISLGLFGWKKPLLANGANLCYSKEFFHQLGGFEGNFDHPSGDDLFLLEKARLQEPQSIAYLNNANAAVWTYPLSNFRELVRQRVRWAGKTRHQRSGLLKSLAILVGLTNLAILLIYFLLILLPDSWEILLVVPALKWSTDAWLILNAASYFKIRPKLFDFVTACLFYPIFGTWVFLAGLGRGFSWKGRKLAH